MDSSRKLPIKFHFYCRHIDDVFIIVGQNVFREDLLVSFINVPPTITSTFKNNYDNKLYFLDISLNRCEDGPVSRCLYRRNFNISQYTDF